jgi:outer membrane receptor protein involved in Fe transport
MSIDVKLHRKIETPAVFLLTFLFVNRCAWAKEEPADTDPQSPPLVELETVVVEAKLPKLTKLGPLEGLSLTKEKIPGNVQSVDRAEIKQMRATSLGDLMNSTLQSVNVNEYQGNPYQMDITYRGFSASPQIGTPQGLSVFLDGVRVNEPFGDVVNWDLIPMNALSGMEVFPGSNPLFGLNTLGGALSLRTRNGFDDAGVDVSFSGGSWNRKKGELALGGNNGTLGGFLAITGFDEDGWRINSPSRVMQGFGRLDWRGERFSLKATGLLVGNDLLGNGLIPSETFRRQPEAVFSSPDRTQNDLQHFTVGGEFFFTDRFSLTGQIYRRDSNRQSVAGDIYEDFRDMGTDWDMPMSANGTNTGGPICQYQDINHDGVPDYGFYQGDQIDPSTTNLPVSQWPEGVDPSPLPAINGGPDGYDCGRVNYTVPGNLGPRNGAAGDRRNRQPGRHSTGVIDGTPIGILTHTGIKQITDGATMQLNWNLEKHAIMVGGSIDSSGSDFDSRQQLALMDAQHRVYAASNEIDPIFVAGREAIPNNVFSGQSLTYSGYFSETWSPLDNLHFAVSGRFNRTRVKNRMKARTRAGFDSLSDIQDTNTYRPTVIVCPTADPASCPAEANYNLKANWYKDVVMSQSPYWGLGSYSETPTSESFIYESFNPSFGISYSPREDLNTYFNFSQGTRAPSSVELGCGYDTTMVPQDPNNPDSPKIPKSLATIGGSCTLPSTLSGDPSLPQIFAHSYEFGFRGKMVKDWEWNAGIYRTDLTDDIYLIGVTATRSFFDTIGDTRRQGVELGLKGKVAAVDFKINYGLTDATFQSHWFMLSPNNSSARVEPTLGPGQYDSNGRPLRAQQDMIEVMPGDRMPGIPLHNLNVSLDWHITKRWNLGMTMIAHSSSYVRGNENNGHQQGAWEYSRQLVGINWKYLPTHQFKDSGSVPGYAVFNLRTSYELGQGFNLFALVNNLFDRSYATAGRLGIDPFSPSVQGQIGSSGWNYNSNDWLNTTFVGPAAPRAFWVGVDFKY